MKKHLLIAAIAALTVAISMSPSWSADTATDVAQVKLQTASIPKMRQSVASAGGYEVKGIEIKHTAHQLTATIVNSKKNAAALADREKEAIAMASEMEAAMTAKPEFEGVSSIHVDYISRLGKKDKTIQVFDFFLSPAKAFVLHKT
jgi:hypothetical protein